MRGLRRRAHDGTGTLARFIGVDAALDAPVEGGAHDTSKDWFQAKGALENQSKHSRERRSIQHSHTNGQN